MKSLLLLSLFTTCSCTLLASEPPAKEANIYVIIGQSNAIGSSQTRGTTSKIVESFYGNNGLDSIKIFNPHNGSFVNHYYVNKSARLTDLNGGRSVAPYWAMELLKKDPSQKIYFVKHANGGTSIGKGANQWDIKDENTGNDKGKSLWNFYANSCHKPAIAALKKEGLTPNVKTVFWMQGETNACGLPSNAKFLMTEDQYFSYLETLVAKIKKLEGVNKKTDILLGTISILNRDGSAPGTPGQVMRYTPVVRKAQERLAKKDKQVKLIINDDATLTGSGKDGVHFNDDDFAQIAKRIVEIK